MMKKITKKDFPRVCYILSLVLSFLLLSAESYSQQTNYSFTVVDTTQSYKTVSFCRNVNYYWDQGVIDSAGNIHWVFVDNYKLYCYTSSDSGKNWTEEMIVTGKEGKIYMAMMGITKQNKRVIVYSVNPQFSNGTVSYGSEFRYDVYAAVQETEGWAIKTLYTHSANSGLLPYCLTTTGSGHLHIILSKYGWGLYGGELYEIIYNPAENTWSSILTIKIFSDRSIDNAAIHVGKVAEGENGNIICMYQRPGSVKGKYNLELLVKTDAGWLQPQVILNNNHYVTYNRFDLDYDRKGNYYLGYFEPWGTNGPEIYLARNSTQTFNKYELFTASDTLLKMSFHPHKEGLAYIYCQFKNSYPKILKWDQLELTQSDYLPAFTQEDSTDVMRFLYHITRKSNYSDNWDLNAFTNRYQGKVGDYVNPYEIVFSRLNLVEETSNTQDYKTNTGGNLLIYPNPAEGHISLSIVNSMYPESINIYNMLGRLVKTIRVTKPHQIDISDLKAGIYFLRLEGTGETGKFVKR